jgi:predicted nucleic-acid-binding protein
MIGGSVSLDTSVLLRLLVGEPEDQHQVSMRFLSEQLSEGREVHVADLVLAEAYFALQSYYGLTKKDALSALLLFIRHGGVTVSPSALEVFAVSNLATANPGFVDRLIHGASHSSGHMLVTFEKAAKKLPSTLVL